MSAFSSPTESVAMSSSVGVCSIFFKLSADFFAGVDLLAFFAPRGENLSSRVRSQSHSIDAGLGAAYLTERDRDAALDF